MSGGRLIPKHELRKIKQRVAKLRKQGHEIYTDDEVEKDGWVLQHVNPASSGLHVEKEKQKESWDCGLACTQMVLGVLGDAKPSQPSLAQRVDGNSVWTIDLAYLLREYGVEVQYLTTALEVDESEYSGSAFYAPSLAKDARRVNRLLRVAASEGVDVEHRSLTAAELWNLMSEEETLVIALVDARTLHKRVVPTQRGAKQAATSSAAAASSLAADSEFMGHYVLLLGLDDERGGFLINDPARDDERTFIHADALEAARHAKGTDEDLLLIPAYQQAPTPPDPASEPMISCILKRLEAEAGQAEEKAASSADAGSVIR